MKLSMPDIEHAHLLTYIRQRCEESFEFFARYFFRHRKGAKFIWNDHHLVICADLQAIFEGRETFVIENLPPRYTKTELAMILWPAWCIMKNPRCEFIHLSYSNELALLNSDAVKTIIKSAEFTQLWPHITLMAGRDAKKSWGTVQGGQFYATAAGGAVTGFGAGRMDEGGADTGQPFVFSGAILIDDPLKPGDARHDPIRKGINRRWDETIKSRRNSKATPVLLTMQRVHEDDFTAELLRDTEFKWMHRCMPALIDEGLPTERSLWPAKHTVEMLKRMRDKRNDRGQANPVAGETFAAQYQQNPKPAGGGILKEDWVRHYVSVEEVMARCAWWFITGDTAMTANEANDPSAFHFWGVEKGGRRMYLIDRIHGYWEYPELVRKVSAFWDKHPEANRVYIEGKANGISLVQTLRKSRSLQLQEQGAKVVIWKPEDFAYPVDKVGRAKEASWQLHGGVIWLPDPEAVPWANSVLDEWGAFTADDTHAHDEDVDNLSMATAILTKNGGGVYDAKEEG